MIARLLIALIFTASVAADEQPVAAAPIALAELASQAEFIALAQVRDTDYFTRRDIPVSGSAYLRILIPYKVDDAGDDSPRFADPGGLIEINEEGLHPNECYFPNPTVFEEGRRYLVFLRRNPDDAEQYLRLDAGCALEVLVDENNRYAVRVPPAGIALSDDFSEWITPMRFADAYSIVADEDLPPEDRENWLKQGWIEADGENWRFTHGIPLGDFRRLLNLNQDM